jgi:hypothetical protein
MQISNHLSTDPPRLYFEPPRLHRASVHGHPWLRFEPPPLLNFCLDANPTPDPASDFYVDSDPAFHSDADPDPASQNDPDPQHWKWAYFDFFPHFVFLGKASSASVTRVGQVTGVTSDRKEKYPGKPYEILQSQISVNDAT